MRKFMPIENDSSGGFHTILLQHLRKENSMEKGEKIGQERGEQLAKAIFKLHDIGKSPQEIAEECYLSLEKVEQILE